MSSVFIWINLLYPFAHTDACVCTDLYNCYVSRCFATLTFEYHKGRIHVMKLFSHSSGGAASEGAAQHRLPDF